MKIAIIDDEIHWLEQTEKILYQYYNKKELQLDKFKSGIEYLKTKETYDVTFVDIEMPLLDGFDTILKAKKNNKTGIFIILTTHLEMSRKGYMVNAFRFIDKNHLKEELFEATKSIEILLKRNKKIQVKVVGEGKQELTLKNIIYVETEKHCILIHTKHGIKRCSNTMTELQHILPDKYFYRCHNSFIVNLDEIKNIKDTILFMSNGDNIDVSIRKMWEFKKVYLKRLYECANA